MHETRWEPHGAWHHLHGNVAASERSSALAEVVGDARLADALYFIFDYTGTWSIEATDSEAATILELLNVLVTNANPKMQVVYVLNGIAAPLYFDKASASGAVSYARIFNTLTEARAWLKMRNAATP